MGGIFETRGCEGPNLSELSRENNASRGSSRCKGPEVGMRLRAPILGRQLPRGRSVGQDWIAPASPAAAWHVVGAQ